MKIKYLKNLAYSKVKLNGNIIILYKERGYIMKKFYQKILAKKEYVYIVILGIGISYLMGLIMGIVNARVRNNIEPSHILDSASSILGGMFGVIGAFIVLKFQINYEGRELSRINSNCIKDLLEYLISETDKTIDIVIENYIRFYKNEINSIVMIKEQLKPKGKNIQINNVKINIHSKFDEGTFPYMISALGLSDEERSVIDNCVGNNNIGDKTFDKYNYSEIRNEVIKIFRERETENLIYDNQWYNHLYQIDWIKNEDRSAIIKWINLSKKNIYRESEDLEYTKSTIKDLEKLKLDLHDDGDLDKQFFVKRNLYFEKRKQAKLTKEIMSYISNFIKYRDEIINISTIYFENERFKTSTELLKEKLNYIESGLQKDSKELKTKDGSK